MPFGLDTNIVCYFLDPGSPEHARTIPVLQSLSAQSTAAINPTVVHEAYHTLVYSHGWNREDARRTLSSLIRHPFVEFLNQTRSISLTALSLAERYDLGGRDSLILANYLVNRIPMVYTHDSELLDLGELEWRNRRMKLTDPMLK
jgi:predicted nucleic acid-binding protein